MGKTISVYNKSAEWYPKRTAECNEACETVLSGIAQSLDSNINKIPDNADSQDSQVRLFASISGMTATTTVLAVLTICIFTITPALSAFQCVECPENFFCKNGQKTACPASTPVTNGTQKSSSSDCMTCYQKTGNSTTAGFKDGICTDCYTANPNNPAWNGSSCTTCLAAEGAAKPVYSDLAGRCVSCAEKDSSTPNWNGSACVGCGENTPYFNPNTLACEACPADKPNWDGTQCVTCEDGYYEEEITCADGTEWNEDTKQCEETVPEGAFIIPTTDGKSFYITPGMSFRIYPYSDPPEAGKVYCVSKAVCDEMNTNDEKYPEVTACNYDTSDDGDCWAAAVKTCRDQGKRLPTLQELAYLAQVVYGNTSIGAKTEHNSLTIANQDLFNTLIAGTHHESYEVVHFWAAEQYSSILSYGRAFNQPNSSYTNGDRNYYTLSAFCVPQ